MAAISTKVMKIDFVVAYVVGHEEFRVRGEDIKYRFRED